MAKSKVIKGEGDLRIAEYVIDGRRTLCLEFFDDTHKTVVPMDMVSAGEFIAALIVAWKDIYSEDKAEPLH